VRAPPLLAGALAAVLLAAGPLAAAGPDPYREVSLELGEGLLALLPAVEGAVVSAGGGEAYVDLARKDLLRPGMELQVYRPAAEMTHPVTRQVLGTFEKGLGVLRVADVHDSYARGTLDEAGAAAGVVAGDRVRLSARRLRTLLHVAGAAPGYEVGPLALALVARGEQSGRFAMIDEPLWRPALAALGAPWDAVSADPVLLRRLGAAAAADLLLLARIVPGAAPRVALEVRSLLTGTRLGELSAALPASAAAPAATGDPAAPAAGEYASRELAAPARALAAGNILGEGRVEVALSDGAGLALFRWEERALAWRWDEAGAGGRRILSLDAVDLDGDGRAELLVTLVARGRVTTELRRWQEGGLQTVAAIDGVYLRAAGGAGPPARLLGQRAGVDQVLAGPVEQYRLQGGAFERVDGSALPGRAGIFGMALAPAAGAVALYALDRTGFVLGLAPDGGLAWRSPLPCGGYPPPLTARELFGSGAIEQSAFDREPSVFRGRLLAEPTPSGVRLIVPRNSPDAAGAPAERFPRGQGEVVLFSGPAGFPEEVRRSRFFDGYVADLARADVDGDGTAEILFVVNRLSGILRGERGRLVVWRPPGARERGK
jgi:hypothetical protein